MLVFLTLTHHAAIVALSVAPIVVARHVAFSLVPNCASDGHGRPRVNHAVVQGGVGLCIVRQTFLPAAPSEARRIFNEAREQRASKNS